MKNIKKIVIIAAVIGVVGVAGTAFAASSAEGKTLAIIAKEEGRIEDFQNEMLEHKKDILDQRVKEGILTQQEADEIYENLKDYQAYFDINSNGSTDRQNSSYYGGDYGMYCGRGQGRGRGRGYGMGLGRGFGWGN